MSTTPTSPSGLVRIFRGFQRRAEIVAWLALAAVFVADACFPEAYAIPLLYAVVVLLGFAAQAPQFALRQAAAGTVLTALDSIGLLRDADVWPVLFNRALAVAVMWVTAVGVTMYRLAADRRAETLRALEGMKYALDQSAIVATTDVLGRIRFVNDKFCEISKYTREELIGQDHRIINSGYHSAAFIGDLWRTIAQGRVWRGEIRNRAKDGSIYWVDTTIVPFLDERGHPWQYMAIRYEITERKVQEQRLRDQAALAALGEFSAVVAHEVRNPLAGIRGGVQLMASELPAGSDSLTLSDEIVARIDALNSVIEDLLTFARRREFKVSTVALHPFVSNLVSGFRYDSSMSGLDVDVSGDTDVTIDADADQLRLVFLNLLVNAGQAMGGRGRIALSIAQHGEDAYAISVADRGPGIPEELHAKVFEPFFTTKHRGSGLGLPTVKRVVEAHHGAITLAAHPDGGTIVRVVLPRRQPVVGDVEVAQDSAPGLRD